MGMFNLEPDSVYVDLNLIKEVRENLTPELKKEKADKVRKWMQNNPENKWVQDLGFTIIGKLLPN